jgi:hypothetical protein
MGVDLHDGASLFFVKSAAVFLPLCALFLLLVLTDVGMIEGE